jgi:glycosyltransferase involved in cell wall biosynthesis
MKDKLLVFSYYSNMPGACQAEWIDDKIDSLIKNGNDIALVSSTSTRKSYFNIVNWRVPSISFSDYFDEIKRANKLQIISILLLPVVFTLGLLFDLLLIIVTKGIGDGRWSWFISATIAGFFLALKFKPTKILTSGGPASAHLAGIIVGKLFSIPVIVELQDPLSGDGIGRNDEARGWLYKVEKFIINYADMTVYVTEEAAKFAKKQFNSLKISFVYPGSRDFGIKHNKNEKKDNSNKIQLVHLGTLYATRNFDAIIKAIDSLIEQKLLTKEEIELINLGHVGIEVIDRILTKSYVKVLPSVSREEALSFASKCDATLLIQNGDERSTVTIPYKTYDYLNINNHILALLNSDELTSLIKSSGHTAVDVNDVKAISECIMKIKNGDTNNGEFNSIDAIIQADSLINIALK